MGCNIVTIDGPSGTGKGTIGRILASELKWQYLDSGLVYRAISRACQIHKIAWNNISKISELVANIDLDVNFMNKTLILDGFDISNCAQTEACAQFASKLGAVNENRNLINAKINKLINAEDLVADGRDMGTVVFPEAKIKLFLDASAEERAKRRSIQLQNRGIGVKINDILVEIRRRDIRDRNRNVAPLVPASDAIVIDTTYLGVDEVLSQVLEHVSKAYEI